MEPFDIARPPIGGQTTLGTKGHTGTEADRGVSLAASHNGLGGGGECGSLEYNVRESCFPCSAHCHIYLLTSGPDGRVPGVAAALGDSRLAWFTARARENGLKMGSPEVDATFGHQSGRSASSSLLLPLSVPGGHRTFS